MPMLHLFVCVLAVHTRGKQMIAEDHHHLIDISLDEDSIGYVSQEVEHERKVAILDLLEENYFEIVGVDRGPYALDISTRDRKLVLAVRHHADAPDRVYQFILSMAPFKTIIKDYFLLCESYYDAIRHAPPQHIEAIDMGRRGMHNEGSDLLRERLKGKITLNHDTARRLFTLICALHMKSA